MKELPTLGQHIRQLAKEGRTFRVSFPYGGEEALKEAFGEGKPVQALVWQIEGGVLILCDKEVVWLAKG